MNTHVKNALLYGVLPLAGIAALVAPWYVNSIRYTPKGKNEVFTNKAEEGEARFALYNPSADSEGAKALTFVPRGDKRPKCRVVLDSREQDIKHLENHVVYDATDDKFVPQDRIELVRKKKGTLDNKLSEDALVLEALERLLKGSN